MGISTAQALNSFLSGSEEMCYFSSDFTDGSFDIIPCPFSKRLFETNKEPISQLISCNKIHKADLPLVSAFCGDLLSNDEQPCLDEHYNIDFRIDMSDTDEPDWRWATMTVLVGKTVDGRHVSHTICHIRLMNSAELLTKPSLTALPMTSTLLFSQKAFRSFLTIQAADSLHLCSLTLKNLSS